MRVQKFLLDAKAQILFYSALNLDKAVKVQPFANSRGLILINGFNSFQFLGAGLPPKQAQQKRKS